MKGIILAGGTGSRVYPSTKTISKQLLPVYDKPTIYYPLTTLIKLGITEVMIITNGLSYSHLLTLFNQADGGSKPYLGINFTFKIQTSPSGIAEALIIAEEWQGEDDVCLILGDNIFTGIKKPNIKYGAGVVSYRVSNPSDYTAGERARALKPSARGEIEITDLNKSYLEDNELTHTRLDSNYAWFDTGNPDEMFAASMYVKSIQERTNSMIGCIEGESWKQGNITEEEFKKIVKKMPDCSYKTNVAMSYFWG